MKKYEVIEQWFHKKFDADEIKPGEKLPSESDLCSRFSVSRNVVRQALSNLRISGYIRSIDKVGSFRVDINGEPVRSTGNIGIITYTLDSYVFPQILRGSGRELNLHGYHLLLGHSDYCLEQERSILTDFLNKRVEGLIFQPIYSPRQPTNIDILDKFESRNIPVVLIDNHYNKEKFSSITLNDREAGRIAADRLLKAGHRELGIVSVKDYFPKTERLQGFEEILEANGIRLKEEDRILLPPTTADHSRAVFQKMVEVFSRTTYPTAFFCTSDEDAMGLIQAAQEKKLSIPDDLSVIGHDNWYQESLNQLKLTTFEYPGEVIGKMAAQLIIERLPLNSLSTHTARIIQPHFVEGTTIKRLS